MRYVVLFPTAFFLAAAYPMGLFLLLITASCYCMRRGHWWLAGVVGGFATAARMSAILLGVVFVLEYLRQHGRRIRWNASAVALVPVGLVAYLAYCATRRGFMAPFEAAGDWRRSAAMPWEGWLRLARTLFVDHDLRLFQVVDFALVTLVGALLVAGLVGPWKLRPDQLPLCAFGVALFLFAISFPVPEPDPIRSASRYMLEVVPAFLVLAAIGRRRWVDWLIIDVFVPLQLVLLNIFITGGWVA